MTSPRLFVVLAVLALPLAAQAQGGRVSIENLTINEDPPPDEYREVLAEGLRPSLLRIRECYATTLSTRPTVGGDYTLRMWVSNREVIRITPETHVGDDTLEECTRTAIYAFRLPPEAPSGGAWVHLTVRFTAPPPGSVVTAPPATTPPATTPPATTPPATTPPGTTPPATTPPTLSVTPPTASLSDLMTVLPVGAPTLTIESLSGAMERARFEGALPVPALAVCSDGSAGSFSVRVSINREGAISARAGRGMASAVRTCVVRTLEAMTLPAGSGPTRARVTVTFPAR